MGSGLLVVAPDGGGPATYVARGRHRLPHPHLGRRAALRRDWARRSTAAAAETTDDACRPARAPPSSGASRSRRWRGRCPASTPTVHDDEARSARLERERTMTLLDHQPRLRLAPAAARDPRHRPGASAASASSSRPARPPPPSSSRSASSASTCSSARGSNPGVIRAEEQPEGEDDSLRGFFDATRQRHGRDAGVPGGRAAHRPHVAAGRDGARGARVVAAVQPDQIVVDHLAFSARLALVAGGRAVRRRRPRAPDARCPSATRSTGSRPSWPRRVRARPRRPWLSCASSASGSSASFTARVERRAGRARPLSARRRPVGVRGARRPAAPQLPGRAGRPVTAAAAHAFLGSAVRTSRSTPRSRRGSRPPTSRSSTSASAASCRCARTCSRAWPRRSGRSGCGRRSRSGRRDRAESLGAPRSAGRLARAGVPAAGDAARRGRPRPSRTAATTA